MKKILLVLGITVLLISIPLGVFLVRQRQELRMRAAPATVLSLSPATATQKIGEAFTVNITIAAGENQVVSADLDLKFDPTILEALSVSSGSFLLSPQEPTKILDKPGEIKYSLFTLTAQKGEGTLALIVFKGRGEGTSKVEFEETTTVGGLGETEALSRTNPGSYTITATAGPTATPTLGPTTPTSGPTATPTPSPTATPTPTKAPTPTPTQTSGQGGTTLPTATPAPTATPTPVPGATIIALVTPTPSLPVSGTSQLTILFLGSGLLLFLVGAVATFLKF